ncbi:hypothetical protein [Kribbella qitaiheensis]|uniref:hypothetical protein n=1 Tax=Kribbella qitaiheensis TaxID=1544730 RepID=UPI001FE91F9D|nr:hypothetical protein [Kribbella qitaiheensis]
MNILNTKNGPLFIDFENTARGPVEYDLAWVPREVSQHYPDADQDLVGECRGSYSRSSQRIAGVSTTNTRAADNREWRSFAGQVQRSGVAVVSRDPVVG